MEEKAWAGIDAGKGFHWAHVVDAAGTKLLSRGVENDEANLCGLINEVLSLAEDIVWAIGQAGGTAALLLVLLWEREQRVLYVPDLAVDWARDAYRGESQDGCSGRPRHRRSSPYAARSRRTRSWRKRPRRVAVPACS